MGGFLGNIVRQVDIQNRFAMSIENITYDQLVNKYRVAQTEIAHLKREQQIKSAIEKEKSKIEHSLRERIKELNCLYGVAELIAENADDIDSAMQGIVGLLPMSWQYPEIASARITLKDNEYSTLNFTSSSWRQSAVISESGEQIGIVEVFYLEEMPEMDEGPFLREERLLINAISIRIGSAMERITMNKQLEIERESLQNANIALREILQKVKDEQNEIGKVILTNVNKTIIPILNAMRDDSYPGQHKYIDMVEKQLEEVTSPFVSKLSARFMELTSSEIQICNMIKNGLSTKEIAGLRHISQATVNRHRENIRRKLGLRNQKINLPTYLQTHLAE